MADRSSVRISSRRKTPQPVAQSRSPPKRNARITRSQSREIIGNDAVKIGAGQFQEISRKPNTIGGEESTESGGTTKNEAVHPSRPLQGLPKIDESPNITYPQLSQNDAVADEAVERGTDTAHRQSGQTIRSTGRISGFSGTTIRTSQSGQELSGASADDMVDTLEGLSDASDKILSLLLPQDLSEPSIQNMKTRNLDTKTRESRQLGRYDLIFKSFRDVYGDAQSIDVPGAIQTALNLPKNENLPPGQWRMDPVLYKANLTALVKTVMVQDSENVEKRFDDLDKDFPRPFLQGFVPMTSVEKIVDGSALLMDTFTLALEIRTRSFIENAKRLVHLPNFDPDSVLHQLFYRDGNALAGWDVTGMRSEDLAKSPELRDLIIYRLDRLRLTFSEIDGPYIDLESLEDDFPQNKLLVNLTRWSQLRLHEISSQLGHLKGASGVADALQRFLDGDGHGSVEPDADQNMQPYVPDSALAPIPLPIYEPLPAIAIRPAVARLKQHADSRRASREQQELVQNPTTAMSSLPGSSSARVTAMPTKNMLVPAAPASAPAKVQNKILSPSRRPSEWQQSPVDDDERLFLDNVIAPRLVDNILQTFERDNAESNKENMATQPGPQRTLASRSIPRREAPTRKGKFIDAQPGAERLAWESQGQGLQSSSASNSRQLVVQHTQEQDTESHIESSEDEGFQQDTRRVTRTKKRNVAPRDDSSNLHRRSPAKRARHVIERRDPVEVDVLGSTLERQNNVNEAPRPSQVEVYREVNSTAKHRVASQPKRPQTRTPWSAVETNRLQELIEEYGLSWSLLKKRDEEHDDGQKLADRDQTALKDKARNMKMDYLKVSAYLPKNFNGIPVHAALIKKLTSMGIYYDQDTGMRTDGDFPSDDE
ncbi:MAG: hypothetical protein Q9186_005371 [Xanthomendoza sp. 1 TL-2023]